MSGPIFHQLSKGRVRLRRRSIRGHAAAAHVERLRTSETAASGLGAWARVAGAREAVCTSLDRLFALPDWVLVASAKTFASADPTFSAPGKTLGAAGKALSVADQIRSGAPKSFSVAGKTLSAADQTFSSSDKGFSSGDKTESKPDKTQSAADKVKSAAQKATATEGRARFDRRNAASSRAQVALGHAGLAEVPLRETEAFPSATSERALSARPRASTLCLSHRSPGTAPMPKANPCAGTSRG